MKKCVKRSVVLLSCALSGFSAAAMDVTGPIDIGTHVWTDKATDSPVRFKGSGTAASPNTVTLSADKTLTGYSFQVEKPTCFDFSADNCALTGLSGFWVTGGANVKSLSFKGGTWDFTDGLTFRGAYYGQTPAHGQEFVFDGVTFNMPGTSYFQGFYGRDNTMLLDHGATLACNVVHYLFSIDAATTYTNGLLKIANGARLRADSGITIDSGTPGEKPSWNRIEVTGAGSFFGLSGTLGEQEFKIGRFAGESFNLADHAHGVYANTTLGSGVYGKGSTMTIAQDAGYYNFGSFKIGDSEGADRNTLQILDGGVLTNNNANVIVGQFGSGNGVVISNGNYVGNPFIVGRMAGASNNVVRIEGVDSKITYPSGAVSFFGLGQGNVFALRDCSLALNKHNVYLSDNYNSTLANRYGTTNNTLSVERNATLSAARFYISPNACSNTVFVGAGAKLVESYEFLVSGVNNELVISNGTVEAGNYYALDVGKAAGDSGNRIVLKGTSPVLKAPVNGSEIRLYNNSEVHFDVPEDGYVASPIQCSWLRMYSGSALTFSGIEQCTKIQREKTKDYQLTSGGVFLYDETGAENPQLALDRINASMPKGCSVFLSNEWDRKLMLRVKRAPQGVVLIVR